MHSCDSQERPGTLGREKNLDLILQMTHNQGRLSNRSIPALRKGLGGGRGESAILTKLGEGVKLQGMLQGWLPPAGKHLVSSWLRSVFALAQGIS